jgi:hypothetical protein
MNTGTFAITNRRTKALSIIASDMLLPLLSSVLRTKLKDLSVKVHLHTVTMFYYSRRFYTRFFPVQ